MQAQCTCQVTFLSVIVHSEKNNCSIHPFFLQNWNHLTKVPSWSAFVGGAHCDVAHFPFSCLWLSLLFPLTSQQPYRQSEHILSPSYRPCTTWWLPEMGCVHIYVLGFSWGEYWFLHGFLGCCPYVNHQWTSSLPKLCSLTSANCCITYCS